MIKFRYLSNQFCIAREALIEVIDDDAIESQVRRESITPLLPGLYPWSEIPETWKPRIEAVHCGGRKAEQWYQELTIDAKILARLPEAAESDVVTLLGKQVKRNRYDIGTGEIWQEDRGTIPLKKRQALLEASRWLHLVNALDDRLCRAELGLTRRQAFESHLIPLLKQKKIQVPKNYRRLLEKAEELQQKGAGCLISRKFGNRCAAKVGEEQAATMALLYSDSRKPTQHQVWNWYNELAAENGWEQVDLRTVRRHINRPEIQQLVTLNRDGIAAWRERFSYQFWTRRASAPNVLWVHDGTKVNYFYRDPRGHVRAKLNCVVVIDAHSYYILGYEFQDQAENSSLVRATVRKAARFAGCLPLQYLYDGSGANTKFFKDYLFTATPTQPDRGQAKPIEQMFGKLQQFVMRRNKFFTGQNVTARSKRSRINPDALPSPQDLPTMEEVIHQAALDFEIWNNTPLPVHKGRTPKEMYEAGRNKITSTISLTPEIDRDCFWELHVDQKGDPYRKRFQATTMMMSLKGEKYQYEVLDAEGNPDETFYRLHQERDFYVKYDPEDPGAGLALYLPDDMRFLAMAVERYRAPRAIHDRKEGDGEKIHNRLQFQRQQKASTIERVKAMFEALDSEEQIKAGYRFIDKETELAAEEDLAIKQGRQYHEKSTELVPVSNGKSIPSYLESLKRLDDNND